MSHIIPLYHHKIICFEHLCAPLVCMCWLNTSSFLSIEFIAFPLNNPHDEAVKSSKLCGKSTNKPSPFFAVGDITGYLYLECFRIPPIGHFRVCPSLTDQSMCGLPWIGSESSCKPHSDINLVYPGVIVNVYIDVENP